MELCSDETTWNKGNHIYLLLFVVPNSVCYIIPNKSLNPYMLLMTIHYGTGSSTMRPCSMLARVVGRLFHFTSTCCTWFLPRVMRRVWSTCSGANCKAKSVGNSGVTWWAAPTAFLSYETWNTGWTNECAGKSSLYAIEPTRSVMR